MEQRLTANDQAIEHKRARRFPIHAWQSRCRNLLFRSAKVTNIVLIPFVQAFHSLAALSYFKLNPLAFLQGLETFS